MCTVDAAHHGSILQQPSGQMHRLGQPPTASPGFPICSRQNHLCTMATIFGCRRGWRQFVTFYLLLRADSPSPMRWYFWLNLQGFLFVWRWSLTLLSALDFFLVLLGHLCAMTGAHITRLDQTQNSDVSLQYKCAWQGLPRPVHSFLIHLPRPVQNIAGTFLVQYRSTACIT